MTQSTIESIKQQLLNILSEVITNGDCELIAVLSAALQRIMVFK